MSKTKEKQIWSVAFHSEKDSELGNPSSLLVFSECQRGFAKALEPTKVPWIPQSNVLRRLFYSALICAEWMVAINNEAISPYSIRKAFMCENFWNLSLLSWVKPIPKSSHKASSLSTVPEALYIWLFILFWGNKISTVHREATQVLVFSSSEMDVHVWNALTQEI